MEEDKQEPKQEVQQNQPQPELKKEKAGWFSFKKKPKEDSPKKEFKSEKIHGEKKPGIGSKMKDRLVNYRRVIEVAKKPDKAEFMSSAKVTAIGIALLGVVGFVIFLIFAVVI
jgi:protein transport protein SEC61 subunit gamma-like protein